MVDSVALESYSMRKNRITALSFSQNGVPDWNTEGIYMHKGSKKKNRAFAMQRFLENCGWKEINTTAFKGATDLYIDSNFSETRATLRSSSMPTVKLMLYPVFQVETEAAYFVENSLSLDAGADVTPRASVVTPPPGKKLRVLSPLPSVGVLAEAPVFGTDLSAASSSNAAIESSSVAASSAGESVNPASYDDTHDMPPLI